MTIPVLWDGCILMMLWMRDYKCERKKTCYLLVKLKDKSIWMKGDLIFTCSTSLIYKKASKFLLN